MKMLAIHAIIIGGNLAFYIAYATLLQIGVRRTGDARLTIDGFANVCGIFTNLFEVAGFVLVLYVQIPLTKT